MDEQVDYVTVRHTHWPPVEALPRVVDTKHTRVSAVCQMSAVSAVLCGSV